MADETGIEIETDRGVTIPSNNNSTLATYLDEGKNTIKSHYVIFVVLLIGGLLLFHFRNKIAEAHDRFRTRQRSRSGFYDRLNGFENDLASGLNSANFDIESNISNGDSRKGLSEEAKEAIKSLMKSKGLSFDEARLQYTTQKFSQNNVDSNGVPKDPKLVTF
ncbi:uncharacterized protein RJT21DRAFT_120698 [Scheffersomyces amazonensis]|uniref:uncharacterized protein n=1 Tax=Scheffersomyces amazonensis TaxID=1078765 RepID=UPI00315D409A